MGELLEEIEPAKNQHDAAGRSAPTRTIAAREAGLSEHQQKHAIRCGELLAAQKVDLKHGGFKPWIEENCEFSCPSARAYMQVSKQSGRPLPFSSINEALDCSLIYPRI